MAEFAVQTDTLILLPAKLDETRLGGVGRHTAVVVGRTSSEPHDSGVQKR